MNAQVSLGLELQGFTAGYPGHTVIRALDLPRVAPGQLVAVLGPNGAGKSTLLRAIAGLRPAGGQALLDGQSLQVLPLHERLRLAGYLPQALPQPSSLLAYESLLSALRASHPDIDRTTAAADIEAILVELGLENLALRRLDQLSGGQRQIVGLAQVVVRRPRVLLLDEPTSALDLRWQLRVLDLVRTQASRHGTLVLVALHDLNLALRYCDRAVVLGPDGLALCGTSDQLIDAALLRRVWGVDARVERCSQGYPLVITDRALDTPTTTGDSP